MKTRGIILAGGYGTRLYPLTLGISKQLLPVYDKPMIYYPLSVLMISGIKHILIISTISDIPKYKNLLGNGKMLGINISYAVQDKPNGIAESLIIASKFIGDDNVCLILGDNIFYGKKLNFYLEKAKQNLDTGYSTIFGALVNNPKDFGVISFDNQNKIAKITEKPDNPDSNIIVSGLYFYSNDVIRIASQLKPSKRGELEITDINNKILSQNKLRVVKLDDKIKWIDTGTYNSLLRASKFFYDIEKNEGTKFACIEQIAYELGYINKIQLQDIAKSMQNSEYGQYIFNLLENGI